MEKIGLLLLLFVSSLPIWGQAISVKSTSIKDNDEIASISEISIDFDFSEAANNLGVDESTLGLYSSLQDFISFRMLLYKGGKDSEYIGVEHDPSESENIVGYGYKTISKKNIVPGNHSITIPFISAVELEANVKYTLYIPQSVFIAGITGTTYSKTTLKDPIIVEIIGAQGESGTLKLSSFYPDSENEITTLNNISLIFNADVKLNENVVANVATSGAEYAQSSSISCSGNEVTLSFDNISLYKGKEYVITIPKGAITSADGSQEMDAISLFYKGGAYNYLTTGRIAPSTNKPQSWFSTIEIPFNFPEGYNIGNPEDVYLKLYEGSLDSEPETFLCEGNAGNNLTANLWKFDLKPNTTYYAVLDKEQIFPARADNYRIKLKDTTNDEIVLEYTTPETLDEPSKVTVSSSNYSDGDTLEKIENVVLNFGRYDFEKTLYDVKQNTEIKTAIFNDGTNETVVPVAYDDLNMTATIAINRTLDPGKTYSLTIPANSFVPVGNDNLAAIGGNDEINMSFIGKSAGSFTIGYVLSGVGSMKTVAKEGETLTFEATDSENWTVSKVSFVTEEASEELVAEGNSYTTPAIESRS